jgi:hypothetical protein
MAGNKMIGELLLKNQITQATLDWEETPFESESRLQVRLAPICAASHKLLCTPPSFIHCSTNCYLVSARMRVIPVPVRSDNYAYLLVDDASKMAAAIDPYDVGKVVSAAQQHGVSIVSSLTTHHHHDHAGGNKVRHNDSLFSVVTHRRHRTLYVYLVDHPKLFRTTHLGRED